MIMDEGRLAGEALCWLEAEAFWRNIDEPGEVERCREEVRRRLRAIVAMHAAIPYAPIEVAS